MINKASELLSRFIDEEKRKLAGIDMRHMPTLGNAYEEITKQGIDSQFIIPKHLDLRVVSGFVSIGNELLPEQIDCMLVHGEGTKYGLTEHYIYPIENILCIFEVKKTLTKKDYFDAFEHLRKIRNGFAEHFEKKLEGGNYNPDISAARKHFSQITKKIAPDEYFGIHSLSQNDGMLFYTLVQESLAPISIIHGYEGYKTEKGLRDVFLSLLEEKYKESGEGLGVPSLPTLITSNQFCIIKGGGFPFISTLNDGAWVAVMSTRHNSAKMILDIIWSKIAFYFKIEMPWGDDLEMDNVSPLLIAKAEQRGNEVGWMYESIEINEGALKRDNNVSWAPKPLCMEAVALAQIMAMQGGYLHINEDTAKFVADDFEAKLDDIVDSLLETREFMRDGDYIRPINQITHILEIEDGSGYVSSETDRFNMWCNNNDIPTHYLTIFFLE